ncbi:hypothetical protein D4764_01G0015150 [Takifugu flavidus]|uniref:Reverse transcriptase domain-containing protein n=1 Tax=Takifugu flavidus TaxID=433684 RepID=A0A5C6PTH7_9TELE|nr:hypothetical protein D4764_01G0015150 [Takifugu flavidus]
MALRDCFDTTDWDVLCEPHGEDIDGLTTCITDYINFCVENTVPTRKVLCFSNNKPWETPDLKALLNEKKRVFKSGDKEELRRVQKELRRGITRGKDSYSYWRSASRGAMPGKFGCAAPPSPTYQSPDLTVLSHHHPASSPVTPPAPAALSSHYATSLHPLPDRPSHSNPHPHPPGVIRLLKDCADQLCGVLLHIFNLSLSLERVPLLWKTSCVVPFPKIAHSREPNHFRPVALTSHLMKTMERIVLTHLRQLVDSKMDPLQFAYRPGIGVDDDVIYLLHWSLSHLEGTGSTCLQHKGTVLSPFPFTLYTSDFSYNSDSCHLQKFSDNTAIVGRVSEGNKLEYREVITNFVAWCELNHLRINASKTKEVVIDFSKEASHIAPVNIQGLDIEIVEEYKYLGVHLNNKLDWTHNIDALYKKGQSCLHLLRRLRSFGVCTA